MNDQQLRDVYSGLMTRRTEPCPAPESILALVRREGAEDARLATLDHVMSCADCKAEFDLLRSIEQAGAEAGAAAKPGRKRWMGPLALAASVLLAVVIGRFAIPSVPESEIMRSGDGGVTLLAPPPEAPAGDPLSFAWHPIEGAGRYRLEVLTAGGDLALEAETADTTITLQGVADLAPGEYQWWVGASSPGSSARSSFRPLRLIAQ